MGMNIFMLFLEKTFGQRFKNERIRLGLTQETLAEKTSVTPITIINYEKSN